MPRYLSASAHGERVRIDFDNALRESTIVHWHGLAVDTRNDGAGMTLAAPGERYGYDFEVRDRGALYWYHPHPHGMTAAQAYRGLFGMIEVEDEDERRLRSALDLMPGQTEIPLVLQDLRGRDYAASDADRMHGFLGDAVYINGTACPYLDVASRIYRFRVLNASNARTYRLGLRTAEGKRVPFTLIGGDGGLLPSPIDCSDAFIASAERLDMYDETGTAGRVMQLVLDELAAMRPLALSLPLPRDRRLQRLSTRLRHDPGIDASISEHAREIGMPCRAGHRQKCPDRTLREST